MSVLLQHLAVVAAAAANTATDKPHIVFALVDDWGWSNVGYHRSSDGNDPEVATPNIDALVRGGIELDQHYSYHYCSPARSSLQSGRLPVHVAYVMDEPTMVNPKDPDSGFSGIPRNMTGLAEKMREGGYRAHATGKWDAGMAAWEQTPMGRGYETWFGYFHHANDYWTQVVSDSGPTGCGPLVDLWNTTGPAYNRNGTAYEEELFLEHTLNVLERHDPHEPLFLFHSFHQVHTPLEVPAAWEQKFSFLKDGNRRKYAAMVSYMDDVLGKIVDKLRAKSMWENTLMIVSSDNGGPIYYAGTAGHFGGASNFPLRGGKFSDFEGGVRVNAFVAGGAVPTGKRGSINRDLIFIADWYTTLCTIAGVDPFDRKAAAAGLPPVDGVDHSDVLIGNAAFGNGARTEIHHSTRALRSGRWKLITGGLMDMTGIRAKFGEGVPVVPFSDYGHGYGVAALHNDLSIKFCGHGCLYDIEADPSEHRDVAWRHPEVLRQMKARLQELNQDTFMPDRGTSDPSACGVWNGFYGPFIDVPEELLPSAQIELLVI